MSTHVDKETLQILCKMDDIRYRQPGLVGFRDKFWGTHGGAVVSVGKGSDSRQFLCVPHAFSLKTMSAILVRKTYLDLWTYLCQIYLDRPIEASVPYYATVVWGHPGIGKSVSLFFLMAAAAEARIPFIYHSTSTRSAYVCIDAGEFTIPSETLQAFVFNSRALILIDSVLADQPLPGICASTAHVVLASSPASHGYATIVKHMDGKFFTMSLVPEEEFLDILHLRTIGFASTFAPVLLRDMAPVQTAPTAAVAGDESRNLDVAPDVEDDDAVSAAAKTYGCDEDTSGVKYWRPLDLYRLLGPDVRTALRPHTWTTGDPAKDLLSTASLATPLDHRIFFEVPELHASTSEYPPLKLVIPTPFLRDLLVEVVHSCGRTKQIEVLGLLQGRGSAYGVVFEAAIVDHLATKHFKAVLPSSQESIIIGPQEAGWVAFPDTGTALPVVGKPPARVRYDPNDNAAVAIPDKPGFYTLSRGFPSANALILADGIGKDQCRYEIVLQATIAERRPTKARDMNRLVKALAHHDHSRPRRRIFLFVADTHEKNAERVAKEHAALTEWEIGSVTVTERELYRSLP